MKICTNCKTSCQDEMNFCHKCGKPLNTGSDFDATVRATPSVNSAPADQQPVIQNIPPASLPANSAPAAGSIPQYPPSQWASQQTAYAAPIVPPSHIPPQYTGYTMAAPHPQVPQQPVSYTPAPAQDQIPQQPVTYAPAAPVQPVYTAPVTPAVSIPQQSVNNDPLTAQENSPSQPENAPPYTHPAYIPWQTADTQNTSETNTAYNPGTPPANLNDNEIADKKKKKKKLIRNLIIIFILLAGIATGIFFFVKEYSSPDFMSGSGAHSSEEETKPVNSEKDKTGLFSDDTLSYVMIYNPTIYSEQKEYDTSFLNTGDFNAMQIDVITDRADNSEENNHTLNTITTGYVDAVSSFDVITPESNKSSSLTEKTYSVDDVASFYYYSDLDNSERESDSFTCMYAGSSCYIWSNNPSVDYDYANKLGKEFDINYDKITRTFGTPRFCENSGKINFLFYEFPSSTVLGLASSYDIYASYEVSESEITKYGLNTDHALVHINSIVCEYDDLFDSTVATMAHEVQHCISYSTYLSSYSETPIGVWLDEAMSGYIEEIVSPGTKTIDGHYEAFNESNQIRTGQSLYNFSTATDIGVYGSVYLFSEYLASSNGGGAVFSNIHDYWRSSYSDTISDAEAIFNSVSDSTREEIDKLIEYPDYISFSSTKEEWMSKLTLDFYLNYLNKNSRINNFSKITQTALLYNNLSGTDIEGGGRIIVAVKNGEFEIPENADKGLVYVGLDKNFKQITEIVCK